jgi:hypothetical protein
LQKVLFLGANDGDQLFAIMKLIGSPAEEDYEWYAKHVPFKQEAFDLIGFYEGACLEDIFYRFEDLKNLVDLLRYSCICITF